MPTIDLDDDEFAAVIAALKEKLDRDRYPRAPRLEPFKPEIRSDPAAATAPGEPRAWTSIPPLARRAQRR